MKQLLKEPPSKRNALLRDQIWFRQTMFTLSLTIILGSALSIATIVLDLFDEQAHARKNASEVVAAMRYQAAQAVFNIDPVLAGTVVEGLSEYALFQDVRIVDDLGDNLQSFVRAPIQGYLSSFANMLFISEEAIVVSLVYPGVKGIIGRIEVRLDSYLVAQQFFQRSLRTIIGSLLRNILLSAGLLLLFYYTLTRPLINLERQIKSIDPNNPEQVLSVSKMHKKSELGQMANLLNHLLARLKDVQNKHKNAEQELHLQNETLELMVEARTRELRDANEKLAQLARIDSLTGLYNRRYFAELAVKALHNSQHYNRNIAMMACDLDNFKRVNDSYGHALGDKVLKEFADCFSPLIGIGGLFARYGGEEFVILLSDISLQDATALGQRLCHEFNKLTFEHQGAVLNFSVSIGLAVAPIHCGYDMDQLLKVADEALYVAKENGRNRLQVAL